MGLRIVVGVGLALAFADSSVAAAIQENVKDIGGGTRLRVGEPHAHHYRLHRRRSSASAPSPEIKMIAGLTQQVHVLREQVIAMQQLRDELKAFKDQVSGGSSKSPIWGGVPLGLSPSLNPVSGSTADGNVLTVSLPNLHDISRRRFPRIPSNPATASLPAATKEELSAVSPPKSAVEEAKTYLLRTATPGYTMTRQGAAVAIDRLHPGFVVRLAEAVKQAREAGMSDAGLYSAYRPPAYGVGGFKNKFNSLHSYGLAVDMTGIGRPGSSFARLWSKIVSAVGLYLPYGPRNRSEFNHTQFVATKVAPSQLRITITADGPKDLRRMWLASGNLDYVEEAVAAKAGSLASVRTDTPVEPASEQDGAQAALPAVAPAKSRSPRRRGSGRKSAAKRGAGVRAPARAKAKSTRARTTRSSRAAQNRA
jgi:hypothetical protein